LGSEFKKQKLTKVETKTLIEKLTKDSERRQKQRKVQDTSSNIPKFLQKVQIDFKLTEGNKSRSHSRAKSTAS